jgi:hypothetical protein
MWGIDEGKGCLAPRFALPWEGFMRQYRPGEEPERKPYRAPSLVVHGPIEVVTETGPTMKQEKHPMDGRKGSKIRP